ncbi:hypothetical protein ACIQ6R_22765 [Streptomyces sp. NPDC096048]|uniref:hypothetical protein n=1 Tax=Streptomyces sp. NPDC096048 TaxID=3366072 RepID=UPI0037FA391E
MSGEPPAALFGTWLFQPAKPDAQAARAASLVKASDAPVRPRSRQRIAATNDGHEHERGH